MLVTVQATRRLSKVHHPITEGLLLGACFFLLLLLNSIVTAVVVVEEEEEDMAVALAYCNDVTITKKLSNRPYFFVNNREEGKIMECSGE